LAEEANSHAEWASTLEKLSLISADEDFIGLVNDPRIDSQRLTTLLIELVGDGGQSLPAGGENFINLLVQNDRVEALSDIQQLFTVLVAKAKAEVNAEVITAMPLTDDQRSAIAAALETRLGLKVILEETVDAELKGGAVIKAGDMVIDGSVKGRLEKLTAALR
jgi:F-type H+-transporting ATPase subunit delta